MNSRKLDSKLISPHYQDLFRRLWPDDAHQNLLEAALALDETAISSWRLRYKNSALECTDDGEFQLLPLACTNLRTLGYQGAEMTALEGVYRQAWYRNQLLLDATIAATDALAEAGIPTLMLGGLAVMCYSYIGQHLRATREGELILAPGQLQAATQTLAAHGWRPFNTGGNFPSDTQSRYGHSALFVKQTQPPAGEEKQPAELRLKLHWKLLDPQVVLSNSAFGSGRTGLPRGVACEAQEHTLFMLDVETSLLETCMRVFPAGTTSATAIADAVLILRHSAGTLDWQALTIIARERGVALPLLAVLCTLIERFGIPVPERALEALVAAGCSSTAETALDTLTLPYNQRTFRQRVQMGVQVYLRGHYYPSWLGNVTHFPAFASYYWGPERFIRRRLGPG